ncbi:MAG: hypothetical protein KIS94_02320 [Chitinophagales bacterium]|nr:hypothetical protein [Chitinophagales bacterium]
MQPQLLNTCLLTTVKPSANLNVRLPLSKEFKEDEKKARALLIGGCVSIGICAGLVIAGTTLATQPIGAYTEGIAFIGAGLGAGLVSIPLIVLSKKHQP